MGRREKSLKDYALGGRQVPWWAVMASIIAAETSAATFLTVPGEGYKAAAVTYVQLAFGIILGRLFVGYVFLKPYYEYRVYTVYDFLAIRFGTRSKNFVSALFLVMRTLAMGVRLFVPSLVMVLAWRLFVRGEEVRDLAAGDSWVPYMGAIIVLIVITCIYTTLGGIKAVIWTDVIQATLMFSSALVAVGTLLYQLGGGSPARSLQVLADKAPDMRELKGYIVLGLGRRAGRCVGRPEAPQLICQPLHDHRGAARRHPRQHGRLRHRPGHGAADADGDRLPQEPPLADHRGAHGCADLLRVHVHRRAADGALLTSAVCGLRPHKPNDVFGVYILKVMPVVIRGLCSRACSPRRWARSARRSTRWPPAPTNDWYLPYFGSEARRAPPVAAARVFHRAVRRADGGDRHASWRTTNVKNPEHSLIPIALGVPALFIGPMLGVFLLGMVTKRRGSDRGNVVAIIAGLVGVFYLSGTYLKILLPFAGESAFGRLLGSVKPPDIGFTWYAAIGVTITFLVGLMYPTPESVVISAERRKTQAQSNDEDRPLAMRG